MPYIITTTTPDTHEPTEDGQLGNVIVGRVTRTAVATLEEARAVEFDLGLRLGVQTLDALDATNAVTESGGTIGPLPDGTVIEVRPIGRHDLERMVGLEGHGIATVDRVIAAFNAK